MNAKEIECMKEAGKIAGKTLALALD